MAQPIVQVGLVSNLFSRQMVFEKAGDSEMGHTHNFDHLTLLARGRLSVKVEDKVTEFTAPQMIYIRADLQHELTALTDGTVAYCIHALRDNETGDIIDPSMVPKGVELQDLLRTIVKR